MTESQGRTDDPSAEHDPPAAAAPAVDRRLLDDIFGTVLPDVTRDEAEPGSGGGFPDAWYRDNRPPHHDG